MTFLPLPSSLKWHSEVFRWFDLYVGKDKADAD